MRRPVLIAGLAGCAMFGAEAAAAPPAGAAPESTAVIRSGDHPGFGRIVIDANPRAAYEVEQKLNSVVMRFLSPVEFGKIPKLPRNVAAIKTAGQTIAVTSKPGTSIHAGRLGDRLVVDVADPARKEKADPARKEKTDPVLKEKIDPARTEKADPPPAPGADAARPVSADAPVAGTSLTGSPEIGGRTPAAEPVAANPPPPRSEPPAPARPETKEPPPAEVETAARDVARQPPPARDILPEIVAPAGLIARRVKPPTGNDGSAFLVPFSATTGAAAFGLGDRTYVVFDERRPIDMMALKSDPVFGQVSVQLLPNGTLLEVKPPPGMAVALSQTAQGWRVAAVAAIPPPQPIAVVAMSDGLNFPADTPGAIVTLADPDTGATVLAGTQHRPGQAMTGARRSTGFIVRPTLQGVLIEPLSDAVVLKTIPTGFALGGGRTGLALSDDRELSGQAAESGNLTRRWVFSGAPPETLLRQVKQVTADVAALPPMARGRGHRAVAESMLALGMAAEAESLLQTIAEQDPKEAASADVAGLTAVAAMLAGRVAEADGIDDPRLNGTDDVEFWRAVRRAMTDPASPAAAAVFAATAPVLSLYPKVIADRLLPLVAESMIQGGALAPAGRLLDQQADNAALAYARALRAGAEGRTDDALAMLDTIAAGHDRFDRARAAVRAVEMRLGARQIDKPAAAAALEKLQFVWRGDDSELALRERVAELRAQYGAWRDALSRLRQAEADFPDKAASVHSRLRDTFAAMIHDNDAGHMQPVDFVAMIDENADLVAGADDEDAIGPPLADRLLALDLPERAKPLLQKLLRSAPKGAARARFGATLAALQSKENDDAGAMATLDASDSPVLPADLAEQRAVLRAAALARQGDIAGATSVLAGLHTAGAAAARAQILEAANDWPSAAAAWSDSVGMTVPESGPLDDAALRPILRLVTAMTRSADETGLAALRDKFAGRIGGGALGDMFRLLTAEPVRLAADIQRSKQEVSLAASLPAGLKALQPVVTGR